MTMFVVPTNDVFRFSEHTMANSKNKLDIVHYVHLRQLTTGLRHCIPPPPFQNFWIRHCVEVSCGWADMAFLWLLLEGCWTQS